MKKRRSKPHIPADPTPEPAPAHAGVVSCEYLPLHQYLANRFANTVVMRFAEIEDLLGFRLPDPARLRQDWWANTSPTTAQPRYSDAWMLAGMTATANLQSQRVSFERAAPVRAGISISK